MDTNKIDNIKFEDIDYSDYPDFCDVFISQADYDGHEMTEEELTEINEDRDFVHEKIFEHLH